MNKYEFLDETFSNSIIEQEYINHLKNEDIKIISFDIFDTLFFRRCGSHENIFLQMGKQTVLKQLFHEDVNFRLYRINCEKKAYQISHSEEISLQAIYNLLPLPSQLTLSIMDLELDIEEQNLFVNNHILNWIKLAKEYNKKVVLTSDMYLSLEEIKKVALSKLDNLSLIDGYYISSEIGSRKSSGKLFEFIINDNKLQPNQILHIGDNINSDVNVAKAIGINTLYYNYDCNFKEILNLEKIYLKEYFIEKDSTRLLTYLANPYIQEQDEKFFYEIGSTIFGPVLWEFSIWLKELMETEGISQLNFFMREGYTFEKVFNLIYPEIKTTTVKISRESTNFLTLNLDDLGEVNFAKFREFKVKDFYENYFIQIDDNKIALVQNMLFKDISNDMINYIVLDINKKRIDIERAIDEQRNALLNYFEELGINEKSTFIDFGGGGTVIERLNNKFFESKYQEKVDVLFFMHDEGFKKLYSNRVIPFIPLNDITLKAVERIRRVPYFIEILLNGYNNTTHKYKLDGNIKIIEKNSMCCDKNLEKNLQAFYHGIEMYIKVVLANIGKKFSLYDKNYICLLLARMIAIPSKNEVKYLGKLNYDEGKGSSCDFPLVNERRIRNVDLKDLYLEYISSPFKTQHLYPWMEGFLTSQSYDLIKSFYGNIQTQNEYAIERILNRVDEMQLKEVSIYGAGEIFGMLLPHLKERNITIKKVIDSRAKIKPFNFLGFEVLSFESSNLMLDEVIIIASVVYYDDIKNVLLGFKTI